MIHWLCKDERPVLVGSPVFDGTLPLLFHVLGALEHRPVALQMTDWRTHPVAARTAVEVASDLRRHEL